MHRLFQEYMIDDSKTKVKMSCYFHLFPITETHFFFTEHKNFTFYIAKYLWTYSKINLLTNHIQNYNHLHSILLTEMFIRSDKKLL